VRRRKPNPWIWIPSVVLGLLAAGLGWAVTFISCGSSGSCLVWSSIVAAGSFLGVAIGTGFLLVLVFRSLAEWKEAEKRNEKPPGPGCETGH
jgi:hypothetical protein